MISALIQGDLLADPVERRTATGRTFATATVKTGAGPESVLIGLATFSDTAAAKLLALRKGDSLAATGALELNRWTDREGNERTGWRLTASQVMTAYEAGKRRQRAQDAVNGGDGAEASAQSRSRHSGRSGEPEGLPADAGHFDD